MIRPLTSEQKQFITSPNFDLLFSGGAGSGKTFACVARAMMLSHFIPGNVGIVVSPDLGIIKEALIPEFMKYEDWIIDHIQTPHHVLTVRTTGDKPSHILFRPLSHDGYKSKLKSLTAGWLYLNEATDLPDLWKIYLSRLRLWPQDGLHKIFGDCNAGEPNSWVKKRFTNIIEIESRSKLMVESGLGGKEWKYEDGLVFPDYRYALKSDFTTAKRQIIGLDLGQRNPTACVIVNELSDGRYHVSEAWKQAKLTISDILGRLPADMDRYDIYIDPSASFFQSEANQKGFTCFKARKQRVSEGITRIREMIHSDQLTVSPTVLPLIEDFENYHYKDGKPNKKKYDAHVIDALRYALSGIVSYIPLPPPQRRPPLPVQTLPIMVRN